MRNVHFQGPPMGWNSWYCFSEGVSAERILQAAHGMVNRGLAAHGWKYINIDDCWQGDRGGQYGALQGNERFPDMKKLGDEIHALGLKFGLYSTPWLASYAGYTGGTGDNGMEIRERLPENERLTKYQYYGRCPGSMDKGLNHVGPEWHFDADARQWADWGVDMVKVDWNPNDIPTTTRIAEDLAATDRDILLSLSNNTPFENIGELSRLAQMWRISGDVLDKWDSILEIGFKLAPKWIPYAKPGHWNDLDMLQIGDIGTANTKNPSYRKSGLTYEEQQTQFVLWSMYSAPLLMSCDLEGMDDQTFGLLSNDRIIALDQDPLCGQPKIEQAADELLRYEKALADGTKAVAFFNLSDAAKKFETRIEPVSENLITGEKGVFGKAELPSHGCTVFRF